MPDRRIRKLNDKPSNSGNAVVYVMSRDQRINDNHALLTAQQAAAEQHLPLVVVFNLLPSLGVRSREHFRFMIDGLKEVARQLAKLNISFAMFDGGDRHALQQLSRHLKPAACYFDFSPLRGARSLQKRLAAEAGYACYSVDTHNIIPLWVLSDKQEFAAHTMRRKVHRHLREWLIEPVRLQQHRYSLAKKLPSIDSASIEKLLKSIDSCGISLDFTSGEQAASRQLNDFIDKRLSRYAEQRNDPLADAQSDLSPYIHFGQISSLRIALEVVAAGKEEPLLFREAKLASFEGEASLSDSINSFLEELIVRKELADNFCFYNEYYDSLEGAPDWARQSLNEHIGDRREYVYNLQQWQNAATHDEAWNAAQQQLRTSGKMHGYMRMYWAKKILEWSDNPAEAVKTAVFLNDHYSLDGGDPNGYVGILWSIGGLHDRPWFERSVYGKIRYMNRSGLEKRFDVEAYIARRGKT